jgi:uncharacterized protein YbaR (Trm112 family)
VLRLAAFSEILAAKEAKLVAEVVGPACVPFVDFSAMMRGRMNLWLRHVLIAKGEGLWFRIHEEIVLMS